MGEVTRVLRAAGWRMNAAGFLRGVIVCLTLAVIAAVCARVAQQVFGIAPDWRAFAAWSGGAVFVCALGVAWWLRPDRLAVARAVDEGADLRETLSTALCVSAHKDAWARVVVERAGETARAVRVSRAVPIRAPRFWPAPFVAGLVLLLTWIILPTFDVLGVKAKAQQKAQEQQRLVEAQVQAAQAEKKVSEAMAKFNLEQENAAEIAALEQAAPLTPEEVRRAAVKKLAAAGEKLEALGRSEKAAQLEALKEQLRQMRSAGNGPMNEMSISLAKGDFAKAAAGLQEAARQMESGKMSEQDKKAAGEQMKKMADQLGKLAQEQKSLEKALKEAGLDKELAKDPQKLAEAMKNASNMSEAQKQQLQQSAQAAQKASQQCQAMSQCMSQMANDLAKQGKGGMSQEGMQGMQGMMDQLSQAEMMAGEMDSMEASLNEMKRAMSELMQGMDGKCEGLGECENGLAMDTTKPWKAGEVKSFGAGQGGPGVSAGGGKTGENPADSTWEKRKFKTFTTQGPIIATMMVDGEEVRGESRAEFAAVAAQAAQSAAEAIETNQVERDKQEFIKRYFGRVVDSAKPADSKPADPKAVPPAGEPVPPPAPPADAKPGSGG